MGSERHYLMKQGQHTKTFRPQWHEADSGVEIASWGTALAILLARYAQNVAHWSKWLLWLSDTILFPITTLLIVSIVSEKGPKCFRQQWPRAIYTHDVNRIFLLLVHSFSWSEFVLSLFLDFFLQFSSTEFHRCLKCRSEDIIIFFIFPEIVHGGRVMAPVSMETTDFVGESPWFWHN